MFIREISASLYPWDLADEGVDRILDNLHSMTGCDSVYLVALMHHEKRPLTDYFYPHNPVRKTYFPEDSRAYWQPDPARYADSAIKPITSGREFLKSTDWLQTLIDAARQRGMKTGVELSHTYLDEERAAAQFSHAVQHDIFGQRLGQLLCFNSPDAKGYALTLFGELAGRYDVDYIQTCLIPFSSGKSPRGSSHEAARVLGTVLGGCFCEHCAEAAGRAGIDFAKIKADLLPLAEALRKPTLAQAHETDLLLAGNTSPVAILLENPSLYRWLSFRRDCLTDFYRQVHERVHAERAGGKPIDLRLNAYIYSYPELSGLDFRSLKPYLDSFRSSDYTEQSGDAARMIEKRRWLLSVRRAVGDEMPFLSAIGVRPRATPELVRQGVVVSCQCGVDGITIGHYDGAPFSNLRAIKEGLELADAEPTEIDIPY